jgi:hypothetical protein
MRKRTKRKVYALVNPITYVLDGIKVSPENRLNELRIRELEAIEAFAKGNATIRDWHDVNSVLSLTETMARNGVGHEALEACQKAQDALIDAQQRYERTKRMGTTGLGLQAFRDLYEYHDLQRQSICRADYENFIQKTMNRIRSKAPEVLELT